MSTDPDQPLTSIRVLIVEDDPEIADVLDAFFSHEGASRMIARNGDEGARFVQTFRPDIVVLDIKLPKRDGLSVLSELRGRAEQLPVIIVSAMGDDLDKLMGFRLGCDDYIVKPFNPLEVVARTRAVLRRGAPSPDAPRILRAGSLRIDRDAHTASIDGVVLDLTPTEFRMLMVMVERHKRLVTRGQLAEATLGEEVFDRSVNPHISRLRQKIEMVDPSITLTSVRGEGYRLEAE